MSVQRFILCFLSIVILQAGNLNAETTGPTEFEKNRVKLLSYMITKQLTQKHYSHKAISDELSKTAFDLYLKQLDPLKRFFLQEDADYLKQFSLDLDNQLKNGDLKFALIAGDLLQKRVALVEKIVDELVEKGFDFDQKDTLETDEKKVSFSVTELELRERWRKTLKYQIISRYLTMLDTQEAEQEEGSPKKVTEEAVADDKQKTDAEMRDEAKEKVVKSNHELFKRIGQRTVQDEYDRFLAVITQAFDPHTEFMAPTKKEDFDIHMRGSLEGIGAVLQEEEGYIKVVRIIPGGAASRQKDLHGEDIILAVGQGPEEPVDIVDMRIGEAVRLIRGKKGTEVRLTVKKPDGVIRKIKIIRDVVQLEETFVKDALLPVEGSSDLYGYLKIPTFYRDFQNSKHGGNGRNVTTDVRKSLNKLNTMNIKGLIVDLRDNGGGALIDAVKTAGLFIKSGPIVQVKTSDGSAEVLADDDPAVHYDGPLIVLVNKFSASASEIVAGALQDYHRAIIIGADHSYGKGTVQTLLNLDESLPFLSINMQKYRPLGALKMTTQKFYRINGHSTQHRGVVPDVILPDRFKNVKIGEQYLDNSLSWDTIDSVPYQEWSQFVDLKKINENSAKRVMIDDKFNEIIKEAEESKKRQQETSVDVDLADIKLERAKLKELSDKDISIMGHGAMKGHDADVDAEKSKDELQKDFVEKLQKDPYVGESIAIFHDIAS